jgi:HAD superfamily hydrolase (TIGR01509 family)
MRWPRAKLTHTGAPGTPAALRRRRATPCAYSGAVAPAPPDLVIFDCDGVLVDSEPISNAVLAALLTRCGLTTSVQDAMREYKGLLMRDLITKAQGALGAPLPDGFVAEFEALREVELRAHLKPIPGARTAVSQVRASGAKVCVASQGKLAKTELTLTLTGLRDLFCAEELFSAHSVARGKPDPDLFLHAAATMDTDPSRCAVIEDTTLGVRAGLSAGMRVLWFDAAREGSDADFDGRTVERIFALSEVPVCLGLRSQPSRLNDRREAIG